jgi:hypothetical protein
MNIATLLYKKIRYTLTGIITGHKNMRKKMEILDFFKKNPVHDDEINTALHYLSDHRLSVFPYSFTDKYNPAEVKVYTDKEHDRYYVIHHGKRLYCTKSTTYKGAQIWYNNLRIEQDIASPHRYLTDRFNVQADDIFADIGSAEGILALEIIDKVKKVYLFESEDEWIDALYQTFSPWGGGG